MKKLKTLNSGQSIYLAGFIFMMTGQFAYADTGLNKESKVKTLQGGVTSLVKAENVEDRKGGEKRGIWATQIDADNVSRLQRQGPDAIGGIGDWFIGNGKICAVISDLDHEGEFSSKGGSLIDLGFCDRADDHFSFSHDLIDGSRRRPIDAQRISVEHHNNLPSIVVHSQGDGAKLTTRYYFDEADASVLKISKRYERTEGESFSILSPLNFNYHSLEPFVFNSRNLKQNNGFQNQDFVRRGSSAIRQSARTADTIITVSPRSAEVGVAYGWHMHKAQRVEQSAEGTKRVDLPFFMLADTDGSAMMLLTDTFYLGDGKKIGWFQLPQIPLLELDHDAVIETQEFVYVGERADAASITDQLLSKQTQISGTINEANSAIHIIQDGGTPLTHVTPNADGHFSFRAPAGNYTARAIARGGRSSSTEFEVNTESKLEIPAIELPESAKLSLPRGHAMRLVFVGQHDTPNPDFADELTEASVEFDDHIETRDSVSAIFLAGVNSDPKEINIAAGDYLVYATKGPEFSLEKLELTLKTGETTNLNITAPTRTIKTPGFIASDLHVHSGLSFDNTFAETERVRTFAAEHGEIMVSSEHDLPTDFSPYIDALGVSDKIISIPAVEITSLLPTATNKYTGGHANVFPFTPRPHEYRNGMVNHEGLRLRDVMHSVKQIQPDAVVQLNHPRGDLRLSGKKLPSDWEDIADNGHYFDHMGSASHPYNPHQHLHTHPNSTLIEPHPETKIRDLDFDLIEVVNPGGEKHDERVLAVRRDWLSLVLQGERIVGTANSDSHNALEQVAVPRTMVAMASDTISNFDQTEFINNLKAGNAYGTTGPMLEVSLLDTPMGGTFSGIRGTLLTKISKTPWVALERLEIQINGLTVSTHPLSDQAEQFVRIPLEFDKDSFVTVEVFGPATPDYQAIYPGLSPYAFSNPIYVDFNQDGKWDAPGLADL